jgi:hypothetical protein
VNWWAITNRPAGTNRPFANSSHTPPPAVSDYLCFIIPDSPFVILRSSFIFHPSALILHPSAFILHPSAFILHNFPFRPREAIDARVGNGLGSEMFRPRAAVPVARASWAARLEKGESSGKRWFLVC